jgi:hypothetical protein
VQFIFQGNKRPAVPDEDMKYHEPPKKQRIAHSQKKLASQAPEQLTDSSSLHVTDASSQNLKTKAEKKCMPFHLLSSLSSK